MPVNPTSVKANRFNVKRIVYAEVLEDTAESYKYGPIKTFGAPMQVQFTPTYASGVLYGGGVKTEDISKLTGGTLKADVNKVPAEVIADIYGHKFENGIVHDNKDDQPKDIAIGYEVEQTGNNRELVWFFKGKAKPYGSNVQQTTENMNFSTDSIDIGLVPREFDGDLKVFGDTAHPTFTDAMADAFLNSIPGGTLVQEPEEGTGE